jgi:hypothetical protein
MVLSYGAFSVDYMTMFSPGSFNQAETCPGLKFLSCNRLLRFITQFQLLLYVCMGGWEVRYHIADYAEKIKMAAV